MRSFFAFLIVVFLTSCSTDKDMVQNDASNIEGTWVVTELQVDDSSANEDVLFGAQILNLLNGINCEVLTLTFESDLSVEIDDSTSFLADSINTTTFEITCPSQSENTLSSYTYDGTVLVILDENQEEVSVSASIEDDILSISAKDLNFSDSLNEGQLIFKRK